MPNASPGIQDRLAGSPWVRRKKAATAKGSTMKSPTGGNAALSAMPARAASSDRVSTRKSYPAAGRRSGCPDFAGPGRGRRSSDRPGRDRLPRSGSCLGDGRLSRIHPRGAAPTSANHVGQVGGPPPSDSATRTSVHRHDLHGRTKRNLRPSTRWCQPAADLREREKSQVRKGRAYTRSSSGISPDAPLWRVDPRHADGLVQTGLPRQMPWPAGQARLNPGRPRRR